MYVTVSQQAQKRTPQRNATYLFLTTAPPLRPFWRTKGRARRREYSRRLRSDAEHRVDELPLSNDIALAECDP